MNFLKSIKLRLAAFAVIPAVLLAFTAGCDQTKIADLVNILGTQAGNVATLEGNPTLGAKLKTDTAAAVTAIDNWKSGSPATEAVEALNLVEDDLNLFPVTGPYTPVIDLAIGTAESIIELLPAPTTAAPATTSHALVAHRVVTVAPAKSVADYKKKNNDLAKALNLPAAVIK